MIPTNVDTDINCHNGNFLCGVVEGFYGRPWTIRQRSKLFQRMKKMGLNTYLYAPKDDCKHRLYWRDLYSVEEAEHLTGMITAATENDVLFVYALSPGLDMSYSNSKELSYLKRKLEQVSSFGCKAYSLLFDDIEVDMCEADKQIFQSFAQAQVSVTNEVYQHLEQPSTFLFCPTEYCATRAVPNVVQSEYLNTIGAKLLPGIDIMWTGDKVITKTITVESIKELSSVIQRPPVIWDNIHANDYDQMRMFLGPYDGRSPELIPFLRGVLTNPNCEFEANFIAMHTLAQWSKSNMEDVKKDVILSSSPVSSDIKLETEGEGPADYSAAYQSYQPKQALKTALEDWLTRFFDDCDVPRKMAPAPSPAVIPPLISPILESSESCPLTSSLPIAVAASIGVTNLNELTALNGLDSFMQPVVGPQANSLIDIPPSDSETESNHESSLEPMDCAATPGSSPIMPSCVPVPEGIHCSSSHAETMMDAEMSTAEGQLTIEELELLVDMFYTPFEHGSRGVDMLVELDWLRKSAHIITDSKSKSCQQVSSEEVADWHRKAAKFEKDVQAFQQLVDHVCCAPNKALLFDLYPYMWDMKISLSLAVTYLKWLGMFSCFVSAAWGGIILSEEVLQ